MYEAYLQKLPECQILLQEVDQSIKKIEASINRIIADGFSEIVFILHGKWPRLYQKEILPDLISRVRSDNLHADFHFIKKII